MMSKPSSLDEIRRSALDSADESKRLWNRALTLFACVEGICWLAYLVLAYLQFSTSVLIAIAALLVYSTVFAGLMGLRLHLDSSTRRILQALESLARGDDSEQ